MKRIFIILSIALYSQLSFAQTGQGVILQSSSPVAFSATTVDSTSQIDLIFENSVNSQQTVTFFTLSPPFSIQNTLVLGALATDTIQMLFTPDSTGIFSDSLVWSADVYGFGVLEVSGEGVQVSIDSDNDSIVFGSTPIGNSNLLSTNIYNNGTGTMNILSLIHI